MNIHEGIELKTNAQWESGASFVRDFLIDWGGFTGAPCSHAKPDAPTTKRLYTAWTIPTALVIYNEGGYATTGICLDCVLDEAKTLEPAATA